MGGRVMGGREARLLPLPSPHNIAAVLPGNWCPCRRQFPDGAVTGKPLHGSDPCPACGYQLSSPEQVSCLIAVGGVARVCVACSPELLGANISGLLAGPEGFV